MRGRGPRAAGRALAALVLAASIGGGTHPAAPAAAQEKDGGTVALGDLAWLAGTWRGEGPGGSVAEIHFMAPEAGVLPSLFRLWRGEDVLVLEAISLVATGDGLTMYVRHFDPALVPLETEGALELRLVSDRGDSLVFENVHEGVNPRRSVMARTEGGFVARSELDRPDGSVDEIRVEYRRAAFPPADTSDDGPRYSEGRLDEGILEWTAPLGPDRTRLTMRSLGWGEGPDWDRAREFFRDGNLWSPHQLERFVEGEEAGEAAG